MACIRCGGIHPGLNCYAGADFNQRNFGVDSSSADELHFDSDPFGNIGVTHRAVHTLEGPEAIIELSEVHGFIEGSRAFGEPAFEATLQGPMKIDITKL